MDRGKPIALSRAQKIINSVLGEVLNEEDNNIDCEINQSRYQVSPLESGAQYAVQDLSFDVFNNSDMIQSTEITNEALASDNIKPAIDITPIPSPGVSFTASSNVQNPFGDDSCVDPDYFTSTPEPTQNDNDPHQQPSYVASSLDSSDIQSIPSMSVTAAYSSSDVFSPSASRNRKRKYTKRKDIGRLRERFHKEWVDMKRKRLKYLGMEYRSRDGSLRRAKSLGSLKCMNKCNLKCIEKFTDSVRQMIFDKFWAIGDHSKQWDVLAKYVKKINKRRTITEHESRRSFTYIYYLPVLGNDGALEFSKDGAQQRVCKTTFLQTFSVSEKVVRTTVQKHSLELTSADQRGHHSNHPITITDVMVESVPDHVKLFKPVESHYCRKDTKKLYLDGSLRFRRSSADVIENTSSSVE